MAYEWNLERLTPEANELIGIALQEALQLGRNKIGPEHILLGMLKATESVRPPSSVVTRVLRQAGPTFLRKAVIEELAKSACKLPLTAIDWDGTCTCSWHQGPTNGQILDRIMALAGRLSPDSAPAEVSLPELIRKFREEVVRNERDRKEQS